VLPPPGFGFSAQRFKLFGNRSSSLQTAVIGQQLDQRLAFSVEILAERLAQHVGQLCT